MEYGAGHWVANSASPVARIWAKAMRTLKVPVGSTSRKRTRTQSMARHTTTMTTMTRMDTHNERVHSLHDASSCLVYPGAHRLHSSPV